MYRTLVYRRKALYFCKRSVIISVPQFPKEEARELLQCPSLLESLRHSVTRFKSNRIGNKVLGTDI